MQASKHGGDEGSGTRSSLMYETLRIVEKLKPKYVLWENVKNVLSQKHRHNFDNYLTKMQELGYENYYQVLNAKDYGIPQNRERVFTISILNGKEFTFPKKQELKLKLKDMLEQQVDEKYYLSDKMINFFKKDDNFIKVKNATKQGYDIATNGDSINLQYPESTTRRGRVGHQVSQTLQGNSGIGVVENQRVRKLTPKECFRLMGFADQEFERAKNVPTSDTQLYKQAGNSIVVNVLVEIFKNLLEDK